MSLCLFAKDEVFFIITRSEVIAWHNFLNRNAHNKLPTAKMKTCSRYRAVRIQLKIQLKVDSLPNEASWHERNPFWPFNDSRKITSKMCWSNVASEWNRWNVMCWVKMPNAFVTSNHRIVLCFSMQSLKLCHQSQRSASSRRQLSGQSKGLHQWRRWCNENVHDVDETVQRLQIESAKFG